MKHPPHNSLLILISLSPHWQWYLSNRPVSLDVTHNFLCLEFERVVISLSSSSAPSQWMTHSQTPHSASDGLYLGDLHWLWQYVNLYIILMEFFYIRRPRLRWQLHVTAIDLKLTWAWVVTFRPMFNSDLSVPPPPIPAELSLSWLSERLSQITKWRRGTFILTIFVKISQIRLWSLSFVEVIKFLNLFLLSFVFSICRVTVWSNEPELRLSIEIMTAKIRLNFLSELIRMQVKYTLCLVTLLYQRLLNIHILRLDSN